MHHLTALTIDFSKRLCDATLGEYLAAERSVNIASGWAVVLLTALFLVAGRKAYVWWRARRAPPASANVVSGKVSAHPPGLAPARPGAATFVAPRPPGPKCGAVSADNFVCQIPSYDGEGHDKHMAWDEARGGVVEWQ